MIKIGRYRISFRRAFWFQTSVPTTVRRFWFLWVVREARPTDVDKEKRFDIGTPMEHEGRRYYYWRAPTDIDRGEVVVGQALESIVDAEIQDEMHERSSRHHSETEPGSGFNPGAQEEEQ